MSDALVDALGAVTLNDDTSPKTPARAPLDPDPTTPTKKSSGKRSNPNKTPRTLPPPFITHPSPNEHAATVFMLHGFTSTGKSYGNGWLPSLKKKIGSKALGRLKIIWLNAPVLSISCYKDDSRLPAWHDYYTDHGGDEGNPHIEEEINVAQLEESRAKIHAAIDEEVATNLGGDYGRIAIGGASQGCCMALDAALTHPKGDELAGVFAACGQVYSCTMAHVTKPTDRPNLRITAFHGAHDRIIAASLAMRTYSDLIDAGFNQVRMWLEPGLGHCEPSEAEGDLFLSSMQSWGVLEMAPLAAQARPSPQKTPSSKDGEVVAAAEDGEKVADTKKKSKSKRRSSTGGRSSKGGGGSKRESVGGDAAAVEEAAAVPPGDDGMIAMNAEGDLVVESAWYGDGDNVWGSADGEGKDVTAAVRRMVNQGELRLNEKREGGWYNKRFSDTAPGTWKVMAVRYRYGEDGEQREVISPKKRDEKASLIITPMNTVPRSSPLKVVGRKL